MALAVNFPIFISTFCKKYLYLANLFLTGTGFFPFFHDILLIVSVVVTLFDLGLLWRRKKAVFLFCVYYFLFFFISDIIRLINAKFCHKIVSSFWIGVFLVGTVSDSR